MTRDEILAALRRHLNAIVPGEGDELALDDDILDELDLDSMDFLKLVQGLHEDLGVDIPETDYGKLDTLEAFVGYLSR